MEETKQLNRRTVLQRGLGFLATVLGLEVIDPRDAALGSPPAALVPQSASGNGQVLRFYARRWQTHSHSHAPGQLPGAAERMNRQGDLLDPATRSKAGDFYASCFCPAASFGVPASNGGGIELHTFRLGGDTLFGMGTGSALPGSPQLNAIVGGTGRFAGAKGSYLVSRTSTGNNGDDVEIVLTINK